LESFGGKVLKVRPPLGSPVYEALKQMMKVPPHIGEQTLIHQTKRHFVVID
jgi:hypothetical protein